MTGWHCQLELRVVLLASGAFDLDIYPEDYDLVFRFYKNNIKVVSSLKKLHLWRDYSSRTSRTDANYADNHFLDLKIKYFLELHYNHNSELVVWGAGKKGKLLAKKLSEKYESNQRRIKASLSKSSQHLNV